MNTGEMTDVINIDGTQGQEPIIWCDICGWGDTVRRDGFPDDPFHFCHRHKAAQVQDFMKGRLMGYFEGQQDLI